MVIWKSAPQPWSLLSEVNHFTKQSWKAIQMKCLHFQRAFRNTKVQGKQTEATEILTPSESTCETFNLR